MQSWFDHDDKCRYKHFSSSQVPIKSKGQTIAFRSMKLWRNGEKSKEREHVQKRIVRGGEREKEGEIKKVSTNIYGHIHIHFGGNFRTW